MSSSDKEIKEIAEISGVSKFANQLDTYQRFYKPSFNCFKPEAGDKSID